MFHNICQCHIALTFFFLARLGVVLTLGSSHMCGMLPVFVGRAFCMHLAEKEDTQTSYRLRSLYTYTLHSLTSRKDHEF
ncbi:hypothetical protein QBC45DRAFT_3611 [Copromyces sp. CBS 386.78]|nr:hypothetical protein QBC45DRAFT_3611 [Copromyces sp. CBS 386.78]